MKDSADLAKELKATIASMMEKRIPSPPKVVVCSTIAINSLYDFFTPGPSPMIGSIYGTKLYIDSEYCDYVKSPLSLVDEQEYEEWKKRRKIVDIVIRVEGCYAYNLLSAKMPMELRDKLAEKAKSPHHLITFIWQAVHDKLEGDRK